MTFWDRWRPFLVFGPIVMLLLLGFYVSIRSGIAGRGDAQDRHQFFVNLTQVALRIVGFVVGVMAVQRIIGVRWDLGL